MSILISNAVRCPECGDEIIVSDFCTCCGSLNRTDESYLGVCLSCYINTLQYEIDEKLKDAQKILDEVYDIDAILENLL